MRPIPRPAALLLALLAATPALAEGPVQPLSLQASTHWARTQAATVNARSTAEPQRYALDQLSVLRPVSVTLLAPPDSGLKLVLSKVAAEPLRQAALDGHGVATLKFRTEGGFYAAVHPGREPVPYRLVVLVGEEERRRLPAIVVPATPGALAATGTAAWPAWAWGLGGALLMAGVALAAWAVRRRAR